MNRQVEVKCVQIARMVVKGMKLTQIAIEMGMSYSGLVAITRRPEYLALEEQVRSGVVMQMDARLAKRAAMQTEMEDHVPDAMKVLLDAVTKKRDLRAALEVLDRDPQRTFSKASRSEPVPQPGVAGLPTEALAEAVKQADITHNILQTTPPTPAKPAEA